MAINRKVLINYHSSGHTAPDAANVYQGELVVAHETGKETIFTKNNDNEMVPFISCAQTIAIINSKIQASDTDVMVKTGEQHLEVSAGTGDEANKFTLNTVDVQSEEEFKAYSSRTDSALTTLTDAFWGLLNVTVTGISGDTIIVAEPVENGTGSNAYNLTHREGHETSGFKKLTTDAYGHVTASTDVTTADIQALGFKTSAETATDLGELSASVVTNKTNIEALSAGTLADIEALSGSVISYVNELSAGTLQLSADTHNKIVEVYGSATDYADAAIATAIEALDSELTVTDGKYLTGFEIVDGKISAFTEADLPELSVESAGTGNVVSSIAVDDHKITYQTVSVATSEDIQALSAATIALSAGTIHDIETLSGDVINYVKAVSGDIETVINELSAGTQADLATLSAGTIHDNEVLSADVITYINTISGYAHGEIAELSGAVQANETDIDNLSAATLDLSAVTLTGVSLNNTPLTVTDHVVSVPVAVDGDEIGSATDSGKVADAKAVKEYVEGIVSSAVNYKGAIDDEPDEASNGDLYIAASAFTLGNGKSVEVGDFIIYSENTGWDVIEKNLDGAITGNLTADTVTLGNSLNEVKSLANGAQGTVLTIGTAGTPVWADDPVLSVVSAGTGNVVSEITVNDHEITYQLGVKAATDADLQTLSGATEAISGFAATQIEQLSAGTIMVSGFAHGEIAELSGAVMANEDAIDKLSAGTIALVAASAASVFSSAKTYTDEQIEALSALTDEAIVAAIQALDSSTATTDANHYLTSITITDGIITAMGEAEVPAGIPISATTATPVDTASAVLTGVTASGADNHELTFGMSNKVFSAVTSDSAISVVSAITAESALTAAALTGNITSAQVTDLATVIKETKVDSATTAESADTAASANKVAHSLSATDGTNTVVYDGSADKTISFGTATSVSGSKSMSMDENGVVDVDIIDCGTY